MRLPWPLSRLTGGAAPESGGAAADAAPSPPAQTPPTGAWTTLPAIQRSVGEAPLVAPAATFLAGVPGARPLPPIVEQLGHDVSPTAPAGIVAAPARRVPSLTSNATLVRPPIQRRAAADAADERPPTTTDEGAPDVVTSSPTSSAPPIRTLGIVPAGAEARPPERPLTTAAPDLARVAGQRHGAGAPPASVQRDAAPDVATAPQAAPMVRGDGSGHDRPLLGQSAARSPVGPALASSPLEGVRMRRAGLGAPLRSAPGTAVPLTAGGPAGTPLVARTAAGPGPDPQRGAAPGPPSAPSRGFRAAGGAAPLATSIQPRATTRDGSADSGSDEVAPGPTGTPTAPHDDAPVPGRGLPVLRPTGTNRGVDSPASAAGATPGHPASVQRLRSTGSAPTSTPQSVSRRPILGASQARLAARTVQPQAGPAVHAAVTATGLAQAAPWPPLETPSVAHAETAPPAADVQRSPTGAAAGTPATRSRPSPLPLAQPPAAAGPSPDPSASPPPSPVQPMSQPAPVLAPSFTPIVQRVDGSAPPPPPEPEGQSESDLDDLARKLFGRIRNRLRAELIYEREAKGLSFDN